MYSGKILSYVHGRCCIYNRKSRDIFYLIYRIGKCGVRRHWRLFVTNTTLLQSMEGTCYGEMCIVALVEYLVLSVLAALVVCVATCVCIVVLVAHLVLSVLATLFICGATCVCIVVLVVHLVMSVLARLVVCVATCVCIVVLVALLVLSVLATLIVCIAICV